MKNFLVQLLRSLPLTAWLLVIGLFLFVWFWTFGNQGLYEMEQLRGVRAELLKERERLSKEKEGLENQLQYLNEPRYQKYILHKELGYVEDDELLIKFPPKKP